MENYQTTALIKNTKAWGFWSLGASFYFFKNLLMVAPSVLTMQLMQSFHMTATGLGNLSACFFYAYLFMQIPVGLILDRYGIRWCTGIAIMICALSTFIFACANSLAVAQIARAGMGLSGAFASVSSFKLATIWFPPKRFAFIGGLGLAIGMIGAFAGGAPLTMLISYAGWRAALLLISACMFLLGIFYLIIIRNSDSQKEHANPLFTSILLGLRQVVLNKKTWVLCLFCGLAYTPITVFNGLWGVPFLQAALHLESAKAAGLLSLGFIGFAVGCPLAGWLMNSMNQAVRIMQVGVFMAFIVLVILLYSTPNSLILVGGLNFIFGLGIGSYFLCFSLIRMMHPPQLVATTIALVTTFESLCQAVSQPLIGIMLDYVWKGKMFNGMPIYTLKNFHHVLWLTLFYLLIALLMLFFIKGKSN